MQYLTARTVILAALSLVLAASAQADGRAGPVGAGRDLRPPLKECPRFNGRNGYYGNPWCSPAEQAAWDRWEARRWAVKAKD